MIEIQYCPKCNGTGLLEGSLCRDCCNGITKVGDTEVNYLSRYFTEHLELIDRAKLINMRDSLLIEVRYLRDALSEISTMTEGRKDVWMIPWCEVVLKLLLDHGKKGKPL